MKGKADKLLADRSLSALVVVCLLASSFAGILFLSDPTSTEAATGDLIVTGTYVIEDIEQAVDGNVEVRSGGELIVRNGALSIISNEDPALRHSITVLAGGKLTLETGMVTSYLDQINPWPFLTLIVDGGEVVASGYSEFMFPGSIVLTNGAKMTIRDTAIHALPGELVTTYVVNSDGAISYDSANDGPSISLSSSTLEMYDSAIQNLPEYPVDSMPASNITLSGSSSLLAVNSYIGIDFGPARTAAQWFTHNCMVLSDTSKAHLYGSYFEAYSGLYADRAPAVVASGESYVAWPSGVDAGDTTVLKDVTYLHRSGDGLAYDVAPGQRMWIDSFAAGTDGITVDGASLLMRYKVDAGYTGSNSVVWSNNEGSTWPSTGITPLSSQTSYVDASYDLYAAGVTTTTELNRLDVRFDNNAASGHVWFDSMSIIITIGTEAYVYRWLNVTVGDEYGVPIENATVSSVFTGSTVYGGQPSFYFGDDGVQPLPPTQVLDYMGVDAADFGLTGEEGVALIPYLTDLVSGSQAGNSLFIGSFMITGSTGSYSSTTGFSFPAYPAMEAKDQSFDATVRIEGLSVESPNPSRWLVVPPSLTIGNMTYYHAGDVIVAADGVLKFYNAWFQLVQTYPNQRTVYVDNTTGHPTMLIFEKTTVTSALPINIIVKGYATLKVMNSTLQGVNIVALEHSTVILYNANVTGTITTRFDSYAQLIVKDSSLSYAPVLSGYSRGSFTNTSAPAVKVENNAIAYIYRWIHVTVLDGNDQPLPGALVSTRYYVSGDPAFSAYSSTDPDAFGVAKVNSLATMITRLGSTFVGNYWVNASYSTFLGPFYAPEVSVGVLPYSEPLGKNATFVVMKMSGVLPDLAVVSPQPVTFNVTSPRVGDKVLVSANVSNIGVAYAFNVRVDFYDDMYNTGLITESEKFATVIVPAIAPNSYVLVQATWTAIPPQEPYSHRIAFTVDALNQIPEMDDGPAIGEGLLMVRSLPDLYVFAGTDADPGIYTEPAGVYLEIDVPTSLMAKVRNIGNAIATDVTVVFRHGAATLGTTNIAQIGTGTTVATGITWTPTVAQTYSITVIVSIAGDEVSTSNNMASKSITVYDHADLSLVSITVDPTGSATGGQQVTVTGALKNDKVFGKPVVNPVLRCYVNWTGGSLTIPDKIVPITLWPESGTVEVTMTFVAPVLEATTDATIELIVNPDRTHVEISYDNNVQSTSITFLDIRGDLSIAADDITVKRGATTVQAEMFGRTLTINAVIRNLGGTDIDSFDMRIGLRNPGGFDSTLYSKTGLAVSSQAGNNALNVTYQWTVGITAAGSYNIWVRLDINNTIGEPNEDNNFAMTPFEILPLSVNVIITTDYSEYDAGDIVIVSATVVYASDSMPVKNLQNVVFWIFDPVANAVVPGSNSENATTGTDGSINVWMRIPTEIDSGNYVIRAVVVGQGYDGTTQIAISAAGGEGLFPWWVWVLIIVAVVGVVAGFTVYTYVYGLGKLVECGECGAFIPAASKRCPKCGVEFEAGTMKCSECGAWIPAESTECPNCGVKFVGEAEVEADYMERMRKEYEDNVVSKYRELAKPELGKKYSEKAFEQWWRNQPGYIAFEDWLAKEEEKKKEGPVACPVCGTLNPKEATVCHKCGTVFAAVKTVPPGKRPPAAGAPPEEAAEGPEAEPREPQVPQAAPGAAPRMVIRRPIDRKVVPKKIIKTPVSGEEKTDSTENNEGQ